MIQKTVKKYTTIALAWAFIFVIPLSVPGQTLANEYSNVRTAVSAVENTLQPGKNGVRIVKAKKTKKVYVYIPRTGKCYHKKSKCGNMRKPSKVTLKYAKSHGYRACKKCRPPKK
jgi:hypothetical protein